jgi:GNAT superfamily N-acetyltransferase
VEPISVRRATVDDLGIVLADVQAGFDSYAEFAPVGWRPPDVSTERARTAALLADGASWGAVAVAQGGRAAGHVAFFPARERSAGDPGGGPSTRPVVPGLAHLWQLFVLPDWWGRGVAPLLHDAALAEMRSRRYGRARLFTPSLHVRARRFYERRGWSAHGEEWNDGLGLMLTEYGLDLLATELFIQNI